MNEMNGFLFATNIFVIVLCGALLPIMPKLTRKSFLFGVKVPPEAQTTSEACALIKNYITVVVVGSVILLAIAAAQYLLAPSWTSMGSIFFPLLIVPVQLIAFVPNHARALELKERLGWKVTDASFADTKTSFTRGNLSSLPWFWYALSLIVVIVSLALSLARYPDLPSTIPTHFNASMVADAWSKKSYGIVLLLPIVNFAMVALMLAIGVLIEKAKLQIDFKEPAKSFAQHKKYRRLMGHGMGFLAFGIAAMMFLLGLPTLYDSISVPFWLVMAFCIVPCVVLVVIAMAAGQAGKLLKVKVPAAMMTADISREIAANNAMGDDRLWAWGMFYHNPDDPAYFVGDRFGTNFGFNYSRLPVKIGTVIFIIAFVALYVWMVVLFRNLM